MTILVPLPSSASSSSSSSSPPCDAGPSRLPSSSFARPSSNPHTDLVDTVRALRRAKRIVVICGAGVSTAAAIPDFRSSEGLFNSKGKGKGAASLQDLFHVKCLSSPALLAEHQALLTHLASLSLSASPTPFHSHLSSLSASGRLLRCYTQNIDGLESRAGLHVGIPTPPQPKRKPRGRHSTPPPPASPIPSQPYPPTPPNDDSSPVSVPALPRVIPLHGLLDSVYCPLCHTILPLAPLLPLPPTPIPCPTCSLTSSIRSALSERPRRTGDLRASVVLYGEEHPQGEAIGRVVERDLKGLKGDGKVDMLLVAGTSLSVPGVRRIVKEMCAVLHRGCSKGQGRGVKTVFVNREPPSRAREWEDALDVWVQGDVQDFVVRYLDDATCAAADEQQQQVTPKRRTAEWTMMTPESVTPTKRNWRKCKAATTREEEKEDSSSFLTPVKKRTKKAHMPPTPAETPQKLDEGGGGQEVKEGARLFAEGSLTPLSSAMSDGDGELDGENPFLDMAKLL